MPTIQPTLSSLATPPPPAATRPSLLPPQGVQPAMVLTSPTVGRQLLSPVAGVTSPLALQATTSFTAPQPMPLGVSSIGGSASDNGSLQPASGAVVIHNTPSTDAVATHGDKGHEGKAQSKHPRTLGMKAVDGVIYPVVNNLGVLGLSTVFSYMTSYGEKYIDRPLLGFPIRRGNDWRHRLEEGILKNGLFKTGVLATDIGKMSPPKAKDAVMIAFSFIDGCILVPLVKVLEDRRKPMAKAIDKAAGTSPDSPKVYDQDPPQTWGSLWKGRAYAAGVVFPTYMVAKTEWGGRKSFNEVMFTETGEKLGRKLKDLNPFNIAQKFPDFHFEGLGTVLLLETVYTLLCTAGLYLGSRYEASRSAHAKAANAPHPGNLAASGYSLANASQPSVVWRSTPSLGPNSPNAANNPFLAPKPAPLG